MAQQSPVGSLVEGLFSLKGRIGRGLFWLCILALSLASVLFAVGATNLVQYASPGFPPLLIWAVLQLLLLWPLFAVTVKRGHDRERSALWTLMVNIGGQLVPQILLQSGRMEGAFWVWAVIGLYALVDYGLMPGTPGPNKYGPSPKGEGQANFIT